MMAELFNEKYGLGRINSHTSTAVCPYLEITLENRATAQLIV